MSTTVSKSRPRVGAAEQSNSLETCEFAQEVISKKCTELERELDLHLNMSKTEGCVQHFWKMELATCARDCSESSICTYKIEAFEALGHFSTYRR